MVSAWPSSNRSSDIWDDNGPEHKGSAALQALLLVGFMGMGIGFQRAGITIGQHNAYR